MKENGRIYLTDSTYKTLWSVVDVFDGHFRRYTKEGIQNKLQRTGFQVEYITYFFTFLIIPIFFLDHFPAY